MTLVDNLLLGFSVAFTLQNITYALVGCLLGTLIGVLPGIGPLATIAMLLPATYSLSPISALIMLAGIYYGAQYGGSTTAILVNLPGEASSVVTTLDGYKMAQSGQAGPALSAAAIGSFFAGTVGTLAIAAFGPQLVDLAFEFGPAEYFSLMIFGLVGSLVLSSGSLINSIGMVIVGLLLGLIGTDINTGLIRFSFGVPELADGINFVVLAMGIFGLAEIVNNLTTSSYNNSITKTSNLKLYPSIQDIKKIIPAILRGTGIGSLLGILPGGTAMLSSFASYAVEKKVKLKDNEELLGQGNIRGVAGPEAANNAAAQTSFIPMLALGLPSNAIMALMIGAMTIHNIQPGPQVMTTDPSLFWGLIASMWIGNLILLVLNLPLVGVWIKLLSVPYKFLFPAIILFCTIGVYSTSNNVFDIWLVAVFGLLGLMFLKLRCEPIPMLLGFILGPMMEENFRRTLLISRGDWSVFFNRPLTLSLLIATCILVLFILVPSFKSIRNNLHED